jgi:retron-type reverse transcriptase
MDLKKLASIKNLDLAWKRITATRGMQYKRYFRELYYAYEANLKENLSDLCQRLKGGSYVPSSPVRIFIPKGSGLQRPITLMYIEDQIVYQAITNLFAEKVRKKRKLIEHRTVFSNVLLPEKNNIFFTRDWRHTYASFHQKIRWYYKNGNEWVAHFDLAAYYDTISHELLLETTFPKSINADFKSQLLSWLKTWSADVPGSSHRHGIPQGPISSDFLAETFFLPIDIVLASEIPYVRYVDDIRILGKNESEVRQSVVKLEQLCRNRGLIPQGKKFSIHHAKSIEEAQGKLPSIPDIDVETSDDGTIIDPESALALFRSTIDSETGKVTDKSRARYVLFHAEPSPSLLESLLLYFPAHPENIDAFVFHFKKYGQNEKIASICQQILDLSPYDYVQGEMWGLLGQIYSDHDIKLKCQQAVQVAKSNQKYFAAKLGALTFLIRAQQIGLGRLSRFLMYQKIPLLQAILIPLLPESEIRDTRFSSDILKRSAFEPGLMLAERMNLLGIAPDEVGVSGDTLPSQIRNLFLASGILEGKRTTVDPIGEKLFRRYKIRKWSGWRNILDKDYQHALSIFLQADPVFDSGRSRWICNQNSFNQCIFLGIQRILSAKGLPGAVTVKNMHGKLLDYGVTLDPGNQFSKNYPIISNVFKTMNSRRNRIPDSHPFRKDTGARNVYLKKKEQAQFLKELSLAYGSIISEFEKLI